MVKRQPDHLDAWILGSGIASLTAAVHLIQEAKVPPPRVHIIETLDVADGTTVSYGDPEHGYDFRAGVRPQLNGACMDVLLSLVPSISDPNRTVRDEIIEFAKSLENQPTQTRFLTRDGNGVVRVDGNKAELGLRERIGLFMLASKSEKALGRNRICDYFGEGFFRTGYWLSLATTFGLKPSHSATEFRRYLLHFHNLHDLNNSHPLDLGKYNVHESIIVPIVHFLQSKGVDFRFNTIISDITFAYDNPTNPTEPTRVTAIQTSPARERGSSISSSQTVRININPDDIVAVSLGSTFTSILPGTNTQSPPSLHPDPMTISDPDAELKDTELDENWLLWLEICTKHPKFGNPYNFCTRLQSSRLESFTITLSSPDFFSRLCKTTALSSITNKILTLRDTPWLITLRIPHQPVFPSQQHSIQVCWGYALAPDRKGTYIPKPMLHCSGQEVLTEILSYLGYPVESILENAVTIPCIQPRAAATLLPRNPHDRPGVIPARMENMAVIGPFVDIEGEVVITTDYSVRGAQIAVRELMGAGSVGGTSKKGSAMKLLI
ncbi:oleate hydratase [Aspergillus varians]